MDQAGGATKAFGGDEATANQHAGDNRKNDPKPFAGSGLRFWGRVQRASEATKFCSSEWIYAGLDPAVP